MPEDKIKAYSWVSLIFGLISTAIPLSFTVVLSLFGLVCGEFGTMFVIGLSTFYFTPVFAIIAIVFGYKARNALIYNNRQKAKVGIILGIVSLSFTVFAILNFVFAVGMLCVSFYDFADTFK